MNLLNEVRNFRKNKKNATKIEQYYKERSPNELVELFLELTPSQSYGPRFEKLCISDLTAEKVPASQDRGDFVFKKRYFEFKFTYANFCHKESASRNKFNFVQIRPWQKLEGYVFEVYNQKMGFIRLVLSKESVNKLLTKYGGLAHGTKVTNTNEKKEYAIRGKIGDKCWEAMLNMHDASLLRIEQ